EPLAVHLPRADDGNEQIAGELPLFDAHAQVDLLRCGQEGDSADLLEVHPDGVVGGTVEEPLPAAPVRTLGVDPTLLVLPRDVDDLDAFVPQDLLNVREELLDLPGGELSLGQAVEAILRGDEPPRAAPGRDGLRRFDPG